MLIFVCALLAVGAIGFTLVVRERDIPPAPVENPELKHLETRRQVLYENLKDLQFEYLQGKLSEEDYQSVKAGFLYDLAAVMDSIEHLPHRQGKQETAGAESKPAARTKTKAKHPTPRGTERICPSCASRNSATNRFCGRCGTALTA